MHVTFVEAFQISYWKADLLSVSDILLYWIGGCLEKASTKTTPLNNVNKWRMRSISAGTLRDVHDGQVKRFLFKQLTLMLNINCLSNIPLILSVQ